MVGEFYHTSFWALCFYTFLGTFWDPFLTLFEGFKSGCCQKESRWSESSLNIKGTIVSRCCCSPFHNIIQQLQRPRNYVKNCVEISQEYEAYTLSGVLVLAAGVYICLTKYTDLISLLSHLLYMETKLLLSKHTTRINITISLPRPF